MSKKWSEQLRDIAEQMEANADATANAIKSSEAAHRELRESWRKLSEYKDECERLSQALSKAHDQTSHWWQTSHENKLQLDKAKEEIALLRKQLAERDRQDRPLAWTPNRSALEAQKRELERLYAKIDELQATIDGERRESHKLRCHRLTDAQEIERLRRELAAAVQHCEIKQNEIAKQRCELERQRALNATLAAEAEERGRTVLIGIGDIMGRYDATVAKQRGIA